ncbi:MAG: nitroreductase family protein [Lachnospiraceae bacterium]|nr:nitroreductase family protein [Lachnospiraceae bacterium]
MNNTIQELTKRKSVRVFTGEKISPENKKLILTAATQAPTAGNQQLYTIIDVTDQELKEKLAVTCDHQPFIAEADMVLVFVSDCQKWYEGFQDAGAKPRKPGVGDLMLAVTDTAIAAQNAVVAAESLGIGSCYIGDIMENAEIHKEILHLPQYAFPAVMLVFGYPTKQQLEREKPKRVELSHIVHENAYREITSQERKEMWQDKAGAISYEEWMQRFCDRKYNSDFSKEMSRSVGVYLKDFL